MATSFDITGRINAVVASGSLRMLNKLQKELRQTAKALTTMGEASTASALGHVAMALDRVKDTASKASAGAGKMAATAGATAKQMGKLKNETAAQSAIAKDLAKGWKLNIVESQALTKAVGMLGKKYTYAVNAQKEWVPALQSALTGINKQKAALVASGKAITTHISSTELFDRVNRKLALGADKVKFSFTDFGKAMEKSLGRSVAFRGETTKIAKAFGVQGEAFNKQFAALTKVDNVWREHVTTMHRAGRVTTAQAQKMYDGYQHLGVSAKELQARIKASNGELLNAATYNKAAREELTRHTKAMAVLNKAEEKLAAVSGKSIGAIQKETEASMKRTKSLDSVVTGIGKQTAAYVDMDKHQAAVVRGERALAKATGARLNKIREITTRMRAQGATYEDVSNRLDRLKAKHALNTTQMGKVSKASSALAKSNKHLANEIDALGRIRVKNLAVTQASARSLEGLARKYPKLTKEVGYLSKKVADGHMPLATADKLLNQMRGGMGRATRGVSLFDRAMTSLVAHLKSFAAYAAAATIITGIVATFGYAVSAIIKYDQALHDLQAITQATDRETALMGEKIREVGRTTKFSAIEVAAAMRTLGQAGFTAVEAIASIDSVAALATGTLTSMKIVVDLVTTAIRAFDLEASETSRVADVFANAVNRSKLTIDKLRIAFNYIGPIAAKAGVELEETATLMMMLANAGVRASTSGTGTRRMFQQLMSPTKEFAAAIKKAGYTTEDLNPQLTDMRDVIRRLSEVVPDAQAAFEMFSLRSSAAVAALSSQGVASFDALHSATKRSGSAMEMQKTQLEGLALIYKQAMDKATDLALAFGEMGIAGALRSLGLGLQRTLDLMIKFASSGVAKIIAAIGFWVAAIYAVKGAWGLLKIEAMGIAVVGFATKVLGATTATKALSIAVGTLNKKFLIISIVIGALYGLYKLLNLAMGKNVEVNEEFIEVSKQRHAEERKRLETIKNLVTLIRDELASEREHSDALKELQKSEEDLNLVIDEHTGLVINQTEVLEKNRERFDELAEAVEEYDNQIEVENLLDSVRLYKESNKAISEQVKNLEKARRAAKEYSESQEGIFGGIVKWAKRLIDPIGEYTKQIMLSEKVIKDKEEGYRKLASTAVKAHGNIQESLINLSSMTQEVWENQMLAAGVSYDEIEGMVTNSTEKITAEHLRMYLEIQAARDGYSEEEKKNVDEAIKEFKRLTNTKQKALQKDLANIREVYSEQENIVSAAYDAEILNLRRQPDLVSNVYEELNEVVRRKAEKREAILEESYQAERAMIIGSITNRKEQQEALEELDKKYENKKRMREEETAKILLELTADYFEVLADSYERISTAYDESIDRRIEAIDRYYNYEKAKAELQLEDAGILAERLVELESQRFDELVILGEEAKDERLANEEAYHKEQRELIESAQENVFFIYEEGNEERIKLEKDLNDKLIEIDRTSTKARLDILSNWSKYLSDKYAEAVENTRDYANQVIELENEIRDVRKKTAEEIVSINASTEDKILRIRRAGMSESEVLWSKLKEARRKMAEADRLVIKVGTAEALKRAKELYGEAQNIYTDLGVKATEAAKEGESTGITYQKAGRMVEAAGKRIADVLERERDASIRTKKAEISAAEQAEKSWSDLAVSIKEKIEGIRINIADLTGGVGSLAESIGSIEDKEIIVKAEEEPLKTSIRLAKNLKTAIDDLKSKTITITVRHVEAAQAGGAIGRKYARGGRLPGFGGGDKIRALLEAGEFVINKKAVRKYGTAMFNAYNSMAAPVISAMAKPLKFAFGGFISTRPTARGSGAGLLGGDLSQIDKTIIKLSQVINTLNSVSSSVATEGGFGRKESAESYSEYKLRMKEMKGLEKLDPEEYKIQLPTALRDLVKELSKDLREIKGEDENTIEEMIGLLVPGGIKQRAIEDRLGSRGLPKAEDVENVVLNLENEKADLIQRKKVLTEYLEDLKKIRAFMSVVYEMLAEADNFTASSDVYRVGNLPYKGNILNAITRMKADFTAAQPALTVSGFDFSKVESAFVDYLDKQLLLGKYQQGNQTGTGILYSSSPGILKFKYTKGPYRFSGEDGRAMGWELEQLAEAQSARNLLSKQISTTQAELLAEKKRTLKDQVDKYQIQSTLISEADTAKQEFDYEPIEIPDTGPVQEALKELVDGQKMGMNLFSLEKLKRQYEELAEEFFANLPKFATGGFVDNILARLSPGEFVLRSEAVNQLGVPFLNALNNFRIPIPAFAQGGLVESPNIPVAGIPSVQTRDVHLHVNITGAGEITEKQVRKWILPAVDKIKRLRS